MKRGFFSLILLLLFAGVARADCDPAERMRQCNLAARQLGATNPGKLESLHGELEIVARDIEALVTADNGPDRKDNLCARLDEMLRILRATPSDGALPPQALPTGD